MSVVQCDLDLRALAHPSTAQQAISACGLEAGELVALSLEGRHPQAARAWVHGVEAGSITLALDRPLRPGLVQQGQVRFGKRLPCPVSRGEPQSSSPGVTHTWRRSATASTTSTSDPCAFGKHDFGSRNFCRQYGYVPEKSFHFNNRSQLIAWPQTCEHPSHRESH